MNALSPYFLDDTRGVDNKLDELDLDQDNDNDKIMIKSGSFCRRCFKN